MVLVAQSLMNDGQALIRAAKAVLASTHGEQPKYRSRPVLDGNTAAHMPPEERFSGTPRTSTLKGLMIMHINDDHPDAYYDMWDQTCAYTAVTLKEWIYAYQLPGYRVPGLENWIMCVTKAWYGHPQSGRSGCDDRIFWPPPVHSANPERRDSSAMSSCRHRRIRRKRSMGPNQ